MDYIGTIQMFAGNILPFGWYSCDGRTLQINDDNEPLFSIINYTYGGSGEFFALPNLAGRTPLHSENSAGSNLTRRSVGEIDGIETIVLNAGSIPKHTHDFRVYTLPITSSERIESAKDNLIGNITAPRYYKRLPSDPLSQMNSESISISNGGNEGYSNMPPNLVISFIICYQVLYPTPS